MLVLSRTVIVLTYATADPMQRAARRALLYRILLARVSDVLGGLRVGE